MAVKPRGAFKAFLIVVIGALAVLSFPAQNRVPTLKLTGIVALPEFKRALLDEEISDQGWKRSEMLLLAEGQRSGVVEVTAINAKKGAVEVQLAGEAKSLRLEERKGAAEVSADSTLRLRDASLQQVLILYAEIKGKTLLQHPALETTRLSLDAAAETSPQAAAALEQLLQRNGITNIPDGEKFVMIVPAALANSVTPRSGEIRSRSAGDSSSRTNEQIIPPGMIHMSAMPLAQVLEIYGQLIGRELRDREKVPSTSGIQLHNATQLSQSDVLYALETLFAWNGVRIVLNDDGKTFRAEPLTPSQQSGK